MNAPITAVTVLEDRANVTRKGAMPVAAGQHRIVIERVSPVLVDKTITATANGARVLDARCERYLAPWRDPKSGSTETPAALRAERVKLERERDSALARVEAARAEISAIGDVVTAALNDIAVGRIADLQRKAERTAEEINGGAGIEIPKYGKDAGTPVSGHGESPCLTA